MSMFWNRSSLALLRSLPRVRAAGVYQSLSVLSSQTFIRNWNAPAVNHHQLRHKSGKQPYSDSESDTDSDEEIIPFSDSDSDSDSDLDTSSLDSDQSSSSDSDSESGSDLSDLSSDDSDDELVRRIKSNKVSNLNTDANDKEPIETGLRQRIESTTNWSEFDRNKVRVTGLNFNCNRADVWELFEDTVNRANLSNPDESAVLNVILPRNRERTDRNRGFGYVMLVNHEAAMDCVERLNGQIYQGRTIGCEFARIQQQSGDRSSGGMGSTPNRTSERIDWSESRAPTETMEQVLQMLEEDPESHAQPVSDSDNTVNKVTLDLSNPSSLMSQAVSQTTSNSNNNANNNSITLIAVNNGGIPLKSLTAADLNVMFAGFGSVSDPNYQPIQLSNGVSVFELDVFQRWLIQGQNQTQPSNSATPIIQNTQSHQSGSQNERTNVAGPQTILDRAMADIDFNSTKEERIEKLAPPGSPDFDPLKTWLAYRGIPETQGANPSDSSLNVSSSDDTLNQPSQSAIGNKAQSETAVSEDSSESSLVDWDDIFGISKEKQLKTGDESDGAQSPPSLDSANKEDQSEPVKKDNIQELLDTLFSDSDEE